METPKQLSHHRVTLRTEVKKGLESEGYRVGEDSASLPIPTGWWGRAGWAWGPQADVPSLASALGANPERLLCLVPGKTNLFL